MFVGSPLEVEEKAMVKLGKKLKKNNVAVDVVCFGDGIQELSEQEGGGQEKGVLKAFVESVSSSDNSYVSFLSFPLSFSFLCSNDELGWIGTW